MRTPGTGKIFRRIINGKLSPRYSMWWIDEAGKRRDKVSCTDKRAAQEELSKILRSVELRMHGIMSASREDIERPLAAHLDGYLASLSAERVSARYVRLQRCRLLRVIEGIGATKLGHLTSERVKLFLAAPVKEPRGKRNATLALSKKTFNDYVATVRQFSSWVSTTCELPDSCRKLKRLRGRDDERSRVDLTGDELRRLLLAARQRGSDMYRRIHPDVTTAKVASLERDGYEREIIYRLGAQIGLRPKEIRTLTWADLNLGEKASCTVQARNAKSKRTDTVPLFPEVAGALRNWKAFREGEHGRAVSDDEAVVRVPRHINEQFNKDCAYASIPIKRSGGRTLDLYGATRHTFCTLLARSGIPIQAQQRFMRHTDIRMTMRYTHLNDDDLARAAALGAVGPGEVCAKLMPNGAHTAAHSHASPCTTNTQMDKESTAAKSEALQGDARLCATKTALRTVLKKIEEKWRRRESKRTPSPCFPEVQNVRIFIPPHYCSRGA